MAAIIIGSTVGIIIKGSLKQRFQDTIMNALGLAVMFIGISGALQGILTIKDNGLETENIMLMIVSLALGAFLGELINIEQKLEKLGELIKVKLQVKGEKGQNFVEGFVNSSLLFCIGAMAIIGSLQDGLSGNPSMLIAKGVIDGVVAIFFASTLGIGVFFSILPIGIYQGLITLSARFIEPYLDETLITNLSFIGSILIFGIGINMIFGKKIKCGNILPAVLIPVFYEMITNLFK
ncbi:MAG: putative rane protein [Herbinix sp.]|nr:putative rane protein [Herbinix sp.]